MENFVPEDSVVREIWGKSDTILFIFAGASAEFGLNKAVDWLYFTGRLPSDPLERLFSTVAYAGKIIFSPYEEGLAAIENITAIHKAVEEKRGKDIPQWAYRDVLYMLIYYSISSFELLERKLSKDEKEEVYDVFYRVGSKMHISDLPQGYQDWLEHREEHLKQDLQFGTYSKDLYKQYRKHLGPVRYWLLLQVQDLICPQRVKDLLHLNSNFMITPALEVYKFSRYFNIDDFLKSLFLPINYKKQIFQLDRMDQ